MTTISQWTNNIKEPTRRNRLRFCKLLGLSEAELFGGVSAETLESLRRIEIVGTVRASGKITHPRKVKKIDIPKEYLFQRGKWVVCTGDSMEPICKDGDLIWYNEGVSVQDDDLVIVRIAGYGEFFKRFKNITGKKYTNLTKEATKKLRHAKKKHADHHTYMFSSTNLHKSYNPLFSCSCEIVSMYKVVGICFK